ncbi:hypothetical protein BASA81_003850 [Batrachochytrium salamandrivorans]|nr:hypothetical protein BASA81_003850 [Batrachochytrium salamandrivorans]
MQTLVFRIQLEGELDISYGGAKGEIPISVTAVFEDGTPVPAQREILDVIGCTEKPNSPPALYLTSKLGGVCYRLKQVSKRLDDRKVCVLVELGNGAPVDPIISQGSLVFSKRKNKDHREQQQLQERQDMEKREEEAVLQILSAKRVRVSVDGADNGMVAADPEYTQALRDEVELLRMRVQELERQVHDQQCVLQMFTGPALHRQGSMNGGAWQMPPELRRDASGVAPRLATVQLSRETSLSEFQLPKLVRDTSLEFHPSIKREQQDEEDGFTVKQEPGVESILLQLKRDESIMMPTGFVWGEMSAAQ